MYSPQRPSSKNPNEFQSPCSINHNFSPPQSPERILSRSSSFLNSTYPVPVSLETRISCFVNKVYEFSDWKQKSASVRSGISCSFTELEKTEKLKLKAVEQNKSDLIEECRKSNNPFFAALVEQIAKQFLTKATPTPHFAKLPSDLQDQTKNLATVLFKNKETKDIAKQLSNSPALRLSRKEIGQTETIIDLGMFTEESTRAVPQGAPLKPLFQQALERNLSIQETTSRVCVTKRAFD